MVYFSKGGIIMDLNLVISIIAMVATVISTIIAIVQVKKCNTIKNETNNIKLETYELVKRIDNSETSVTNSGENNGVMSKEVKGGVHFGR